MERRNVLVAAAADEPPSISGSICYWDEGHAVGYMEIPGLRQRVLVEEKHCDQKPALGWSMAKPLYGKRAIIQLVLDFLLYEGFNDLGEAVDKALERGTGEI